MDEKFDKADVLLKPAIMAINEALPNYANSDQEHKKIIFQGLIRAKALLEQMDIVGIRYLSKSYEKYCEELSQRINVVFLTDDELNDLSALDAAVRVYNSRHDKKG